MVMAESERESRPESSTNSASRLQWLRQRREALQEKLVKKNNELKNLCIDEAELTGVLPPEIPLDPGESPPLFRRRVGTSFAYPQNLINKLKTSQAEESALELERQIQTAIAKKAYVIFNDPAETKAVRRKHRLVYQQSQGRLKDLEIRLTFIRQGYGRFHRRSNVENTQWQQSSSVGDDDVALAGQNNVKHRSKKPRPPLGTGPNTKINADGTIKNNGIDQLNAANDWQHQLKHNHKDNGWVATNGPISSCVNSGSDSAIVHDFNDNADMYIFADQCRARTYSHGNSDDGDSRHARHYQMIERGYRTISSGHVDEDEQSILRRNNIWSREQKRQYETYHYNQRQQQQQVNAFRQQPQKYHRNYHQDHLPPNVSPSMQSYPESLDQQISTSAGGSRGRYAYYPLAQYSHSQHSDDNRKDVQLSRPQELESGQDRNSRRDNHEAMTMSRHEMRNDNWIVPDEEEPTWHSERSIPQSDNRFGSIDRRKQNDDNLSTSNIHRYQTTSQEIAAPTHPTTPVPPRYIKPPPSIENKTISKYLNNQQQQNIRMERVEPQAARTLLRTQSLGSVENWHSVVTANNTTTTTTSTTTCASPVIAATITTMQPTTAGSVHRMYNRDNHVSSRENGKEWYETSMDFTYPKSPSIPHPPKNLEIPAESSRLSTRREIDVNFEASNLGSPEKLTADGRTIVHAGKYQPYKEVTKPFEMSDFYKYSTKFRKKVEPTTVNSGQTTHIHSTGSNIIPIIASENNNKSNNNDIELNCDTTIDCRQQTSTSHAPLVQRRICNSAQSMPGQPYIAVRVDDNNIRDWSNTQASQPSTKDSTVV